MEPTREPREGKKGRVTVRIPEELIEHARDACYWSRLTLARFAEAAFLELLARLEQQRGKPYPPRHGTLRKGRPIQ